MRNKKFAAVFVVALCFMAVVAFQAGRIYEYQSEAELNIDLGTMSLHVTIHIQRVGEPEPTYWDHHAGQITNIGKNWTRDQLQQITTTGVLRYISVSTSTDTPSASWTQIPSEISTGGLARAAGTIANTSGSDGVWTIEYQFTASATHTDVQLTGIQWETSGDNNLLGADTFTAVTLNSGDKLTVTWTITIS